MPTQIFVSDETLAQVFIETVPELELQLQLENIGQIASERKVIDLWDQFEGDFSKAFKTRIMSVLSASAAKPLAVSEKTFNRLWDWLKKVFRGAIDKLETLARKIMDEPKRLGIGVSELLARMRRRLFIWILRNSAVEKFEVGYDAKTKIGFRPTTITSKGTLEFGRLGADLGVIAGIIGVLKLMPSITVEIDVQYDRS